MYKKSKPKYLTVDILCNLSKSFKILLITKYQYKLDNYMYNYMYGIRAIVQTWVVYYLENLIKCVDSFEYINGIPSVTISCKSHPILLKPINTLQMIPHFWHLIIIQIYYIH